jgi:glucose/arabinose dehydrogenase
VLVVERLDDRGADLSRPDQEDLHGRGAYSDAARRRQTAFSYGDCVRGPVALAVFALGLGGAVWTAGPALPGTTSSSALRLVKVASGLRSPVLVTAAPGEPKRLYIVEQNGRILRRFPNGTRRVFLDVRRSITAGGEQGLLGLAFHPNYARNRLFYVAYTAQDRNIVARYRSNGTKAIPSSRKILFSVPDPYENHNGGNLVFGPDGKLYTSIGDGGAGGDPEDRAQNMASLFGKLLRLDVAKARAKWEIVALGLRNPWRFTFDRATGDLWIGDVGQSEIEEIDWLPKGSTGLVNFGWNVYEGLSRYESKELGPGRLVEPVAQYPHDDGCSVAGGYVYRGRAVTSAAGRYFYGDYCSGRVWSLRLVDGKATDVRAEPIEVPSLSSFGEDAAGELYLVSLDGLVYRLGGS